MTSCHLPLPMPHSNQMLVDIKNRDDLKKIITEFYQKLLADKNINHFFEKFKAAETLEKHLNVLVDFWDNILFYSNTYRKNAMLPHIELNKKIPFNKSHFEIWIGHFTKTVDENFKGENAEIIKNRSRSIATVMQLKILNGS